MVKLTKLQWLVCFLLASILGVQAQTDKPVVTIRTQLEFGSAITLYPKTESYDIPISIDFGDGQLETKNIDPNASGYFSKFEGTVKGEVIKIYAPLTKLEADELKITSIKLLQQDKLKYLSLKKNLITKDQLDLVGAPSLETLDLSYNKMSSFDFRPFTALKVLNISHNESVGNILVEGLEKIETIDLSYCDVSVFYPVRLPNLRSLDLNHNTLMELELGDNYPMLSSLNVSKNELTTLNLSKCTELAQLNCDSNAMATLDVSANVKLVRLNCAVNKLKSLNVSHNTELTGLSCGFNDGISALDISSLGKLSDLSCESNKIDFLDLSNATYLKRLNASGNELAFLDFDANGGSLQFVDVRDNKNMTACSINFMFMTLPVHNGRAWSANLLIKGCPGAEQSDPSKIEMQSEDTPWILDVRGDQSATCDQVPIKIIESKNGTMSLTQSTNKYGQEYRPITDKAYIGRLIKAEIKANEGYEFAGIKVNDKLFRHNRFVISEANSTIEPVFLLPSILTLKAKKGHDLSIAFTVPEGSDGLTIDWGDGVRMPYNISSTSLTRLDHKALGETIKIEGEIKHAMLDSYPQVGDFDNDLQGIEIQSQSKLEILELFMNPGIKKLDLRGCPNLQELNCEFCGIETLDVSNLVELKTLRCSGNELRSLDVKNLVNLEDLGIKKNHISEMDLTANTKLKKLEVHTNQLSDIKGLDKLTELEMFNASFNNLSNIDVSKNGKLTALYLSGNQLEKLDLTNNTSLVSLHFDRNKIKHLDLSKNINLGAIHCESNGMTACELNDFYFTLPQHKAIPDYQQNFTLFVKEAESDSHNQAEKAASLIASLKGWKVNYEGDGTGCNEAYIQILPAENGALSLLKSDGGEVKSGDKVKVDTPLTIKAVANEGFHVKHVRANGKNIEDLTIPYVLKGFTVFQLITQQGTAVWVPVEENIFGISNHTILVNCKAQAVSLYDLMGNTIYKGGKEDSYRIEVEPGAYILQITNNQNNMRAYKVIVE
ncbi:Internalin-J precursor [Porphyromonas crevioricanis]|uniref:Internalin-J n=1 Tax=Porphyromonas crevioricanis TaxID=393921 RepID=A0A2X4PUU0_9PORP|nr:hypothetical protein [Porphyromonas crevioricanis]GAD07040.1 hypothetical protein PORCAN_653 [Porphyromonas crevioricanis JCM 13913]SQH72319.1 Internalin-J precursor [Porphyromonas crevioricanis]